MRVVRTLIYEGDPEWVEAMLRRTRIKDGAPCRELGGDIRSYTAMPALEADPDLEAPDQQEMAL